MSERDGVEIFKQVLQREKNELQVRLYRAEAELEQINDRWAAERA